MKNSFWKNKKVFITGHTGFKGSWLVLILNHLGAKVTGYALDPISKPNFFDNLKLSKFLENDFRDDIQNFSKLNSKMFYDEYKLWFEKNLHKSDNDLFLQRLFERLLI